MTICSALSAELGEPLAATAPVATGWLVLEQPGPWGRDALTESHLDSAVAAELAARLAGTGVRAALVRRPGRHADLHVPGPRHVFLAHTVPGATWLERAVVKDPHELLDLDLAALAAGHPSGFGERTGEPILLVCTNARRDRCCALRGRPLASRLAAAAGDRVWESSHLGGHRFAPTTLTLPVGVLHGRVTDPAGARLLPAADAGQVPLAGYRGRSTWDRPGQAAEIAVRDLLAGQGPATGADELAVLPGGEQPETADAGGTGAAEWTRTVAHRDGRRWRVRVQRWAAEPPRPESCGKDPARPEHYRASTIEANPAIP